MTFKQDTETTMVIFRRWHTGKDGHGVIALFPHLGGGPGMVQSFEHAGQHSAADMASVIRRTKPATAQEYAALKAELESAPYGYQLAVRKRSPH